MAASGFASGAQQVQERGVYEIVLTGNGSVANPYDTLCRVTFTSPSGKIKIVEAFWDGGNTWRARCYADEVGTWAWATSSSDSGLDQKSGSFACANDGSYIRGRLGPHPANPKRWASADGKTFVGVVDTGYNLFSRTWDDGTTPISEATFQAYAADDVANGVDLCFADINGGGYNDPSWKNFWSDTGTYDKPNLAAFQKTDERLRWLLLNFPNLFINMTLLAESPDGYQVDTKLWATLTSAKKTRYMRYVIARFAAFPQMTWCFVNDTSYDASHPKNVAMVNEVGAYFKANDPYGSLRGTGGVRGAGYSFLNAAWNSYIRLETGSALSADQVASYLSSPNHVWDSEDVYEGDGITNPNYFFRWLFLSWILSGGTATYGNNHWDRLTPYEGSGFHGLDSAKNITDYFAQRQIDTAKLAESDALVSDADGATGTRRVQALGNAGELVIYHPNSSSAGTGAALKSTVAKVKVNLTGLSGTWGVEWFRVSDGTAAAAASIAGGANVTLTAPWSGVDVLLHLLKVETPPPGPTDAELAAAAKAHFEATTISYPAWLKKVAQGDYADVTKTQWWQGFNSTGKIT